MLSDSRWDPGKRDLNQVTVSTAIEKLLSEAAEEAGMQVYFKYKAYTAW